MESSPNITFRKATLNDLELLRYWDEQPHVQASDPNEDWDWEDDLKYDQDWREQLIVQLDDRPLGFVQIMDPALDESQYWGKMDANQRAIDIWIGEAEDLNHGYGSHIMQKVFEKCFAPKEVSGIWIDPMAFNFKAHRFYERLGFRFVEYRQFGPDYCKVFHLSRERYERNLN